jgi:hypothetical protein
MSKQRKVYIGPSMDELEKTIVPLHIKSRRENELHQN